MLDIGTLSFTSSPIPNIERLMLAFLNILARAFSLPRLAARSCCMSCNEFSSTTIQSLSFFISLATSVIKTVFPQPLIPVIIYICCSQGSDKNELIISFFCTFLGIDCKGSFPNIKLYGFVIGMLLL